MALPQHLEATDHPRPAGPITDAATTLIHWDPDYDDASTDEYLAFCLEGFLVDYALPEEEVVFEGPSRTKEKRKSSNPKKSKSIASKKDRDKTTEDAIVKPKKSRSKSSKSKPKKSKSLPAVPSKRRTKTPSKKKSLCKSSSGSKKNKKKEPQNQKQVDVIPALVRKASMHSSTESSSEAASFFDDYSEGANTYNENPVPVPASPQIDEAERKRLKTSLIMAASDAASLGRLTRLREKVVESVAEEAPVVQAEEDTWTLKWCAAETDSSLDRSNHFQVINEAAAMGQMKRVRKTGTPRRAMSLQGWAEHPDEDDEKQQRLDSMRTTHGGERHFLRKKKKDLLLSSHERMDRHVEDSKAGKKTSMYAPEQVLERQQQNHDILSKLMTGDMDWLPTTEVPGFVHPKVYISDKRVRTSVVDEVAKACAIRNHRLQCNFRLTITRKCKCPYCKDPSALQTHAYQQLSKQQPKSRTPKRFNSLPTKLTIVNATSDPSEMYSRSILRKTPTAADGDDSPKPLKRKPSWTSPDLKKAEPAIADGEDVEDETPIWALVTGKRDNSDLPEWASPALRDLVTVDNTIA
ncbi:MAG: hypothetical protein SGILL_001780 [Bacillariaceae sp.]